MDMLDDDEIKIVCAFFETFYKKYYLSSVIHLCPIFCVEKVKPNGYLIK